MRLFELEDSIWYHGSSDVLITPNETHLNPGIDGAVWLTKDASKAARYAKITAEKVDGHLALLGKPRRLVERQAQTFLNVIQRRQQY